MNQEVGEINKWLNTFRPTQNGHHFSDNTFKCIFLNENIRISIKHSLKFVAKCPINNIPALVPIMAWHWPGAKPLPELMMVRLPTHISVTRPQWVNIKVLNRAFNKYKYSLKWWQLDMIKLLSVSYLRYKCNRRRAPSTVWLEAARGPRGSLSVGGEKTKGKRCHVFRIRRLKCHK